MDYDGVMQQQIQAVIAKRQTFNFTKRYTHNHSLKYISPYFVSTSCFAGYASALACEAYLYFFIVPTF